MKLQNLVLGMVMTNVYLVRNESNNEMIIIDPADDAPSIARKIGEMGGEPKAILLTHGHFDHIGAAEELRNLYKIPVWCEKS
ncbi:MAG: MBL fold metallo-hydrolase, partial [Eubacterium sp.]|nr:MBL fold metallo-hydrolase [Eubacterium sp.]